MNLSVKEGIAGGTVILVNQDGAEMTSPILNPLISGTMVTFATKFENGANFTWRLTLKKDGQEGMLHGSVGQVVRDEPVFKQP